MRALVTVSLASLGPLASLAVVLACAPAGPDLAINTPYTTPAVASSASASSSASTWSHFAEVRAWPKANARRFSSSGHFFGRYDADIHVNALGAPAYSSIAPGKSLPIGAVVAKVHAPQNADGPAPILAMEKLDDGWSYVEIDEAGHEHRRGRLHPCIDCHLQVASQDELFGVPTTGR